MWLQPKVLRARRLKSLLEIMNQNFDGSGGEVAAGNLWFSSSGWSLQREATLHLIRDHFGDGERGGGSRRGRVADVENAAPDLPDPAVKDKVVHQVSGSVEGLSSDPRRTPAEETREGGSTI